MKALYNHTETIHNLRAPRAIVPLVLARVKPKSVLDVGCGTGTWLRIFEESGISDYMGIDGDYLDHRLLKIPLANFTVKDLNKPFSLERKFDLVVSLEVAEHLDEKYADHFVKTLTSHGDTILFSAAIPGQGGQNHLNEQWPEYWQKKFELYGFYFQDCIRPVIWENKNIEWWYRQNIFLLTREESTGKQEYRSIVHPEFYSKVMADQQQYHDSLKAGQQGLKISTQILVNAVIHKAMTLLGMK